MRTQLVRSYEFLCLGDGCPNFERRHVARVTVERHDGGLSKEQGMVIDVKTLDAELQHIIGNLPSAVSMGLITPPTLELMAAYLLRLLKAAITLRDIEVRAVELREYGSRYWARVS